MICRSEVNFQPNLFFTSVADIHVKIRNPGYKSADRNKSTWAHVYTNLICKSLKGEVIYFQNSQMEVMEIFYLSGYDLDKTGKAPSEMAASRAAMQSATSLVPTWPSSVCRDASPYPVDPLHEQWSINASTK